MHVFMVISGQYSSIFLSEQKRFKRAISKSSNNRTKLEGAHWQRYVLLRDRLVHSAHPVVLSCRARKHRKTIQGTMATAHQQINHKRTVDAWSNTWSSPSPRRERPTIAITNDQNPKKHGRLLSQGYELEVPRTIISAGKADHVQG